MHVQQHSTLREGVITGALGAVVVALWYFIVDSLGGQPLHTPNVLGKVFFRGDLTPGVRQIVPQVVVGYTVLHFLIFALVGIGLTLLVHLATRNIALRMGVWIGLVVAFGWLAGHVYMLEVATGERISSWAVNGRSESFAECFAMGHSFESLGRVWPGSSCQARLARRALPAPS